MPCMSPNDNEQETAILLMPPDEGQAEIDPLRKVMVAPAPPLALLKRQHHEGNNKSNLFSDVSLKARGMEPGFSPEFIEDLFDGLCVGAIIELYPDGQGNVAKYAAKKGIFHCTFCHVLIF